jgi:hypothetical protein
MAKVRGGSLAGKITKGKFDAVKQAKSLSRRTGVKTPSQRERAAGATKKAAATREKRAAVRKMTKEGAEVSNRNMRGKGARDQTRSFSRITNKAGARVKKADMFTQRGKVRGGLNMAARGGGQVVTTYSEEG